jgi:hypothetical protein
VSNAGTDPDSTARQPTQVWAYFRSGCAVITISVTRKGVAPNGILLDFGIEKLLRDASLFLHQDATGDTSHFKIVKAMFPRTAGAYAGPTQ